MSLIEITKAKIMKTNYNLTRAKRMETPTVLKKNKYGIDNLLILDKGTATIIGLFVDKFKDGFQITDLTVAFSLYGPLRDIGNSFSEAKKEYNDLIPTETAQWTEDLTEKMLTACGIDLDQTGERGITDFINVLNLLADLYELVGDRLKDGIQLEDSEILGEVTVMINKIVERLQASVLDVKDMNGREISQAIRYFTLRLHTILAS